MERARAVNPSFAITPQNAGALLEVCRRLEGIPLAIELAASRVRMLGVEQLAEWLATHIRLLASHDPTVQARLQTLENTIRWSYDLLTPAERDLFDRLSVFAGGWSLEAMEAVGGGSCVESDKLLDVLERLIDKSLVQYDDAPDRPPRYRVLEPLRQFGRDRLRERGELTAASERHVEFFLGLFEQAEQVFVKNGVTLAWLSRLSTEQDNLRVALRWLIGRERSTERNVWQELRAGSGSIEATWPKAGAGLRRRSHWIQWRANLTSGEGT